MTKDVVDRRCGACARSWDHKDDELVSCGAGVDEGALKGQDDGVNPIWAERKYGPGRMAALLAGNASEPEGSDCERMDPNDGATCKMWVARPVT